MEGLLYYELALGGSVCVIVAYMLHFKNLKDSKKTSKRWKEFFGENWDDFFGTIFFGLVVTALREYIYGVFVGYMGDENLWDPFIDHEEIICFGLGMFGIAIFKLLYAIGEFFVAKIKKIVSALKEA